jgi:hypothetical protein
MMRPSLKIALLIAAMSFGISDAHAQKLEFARKTIGPWAITCYSTYISPKTDPEATSELLTDIRCSAKSGPLSFNLILMDRAATYIGLDIEEDHRRIYDAIAFDRHSYPLARTNDAREPFSKLRFTDVEPANDKPCRNRYQPNCAGARDSGISRLDIEQAPGFWLDIQRFIPVLFQTKTLSLRYKQLPEGSRVTWPYAGTAVSGLWEHKWERFNVAGLNQVAEWCEREMRSPRSRLFHQQKILPCRWGRCFRASADGVYYGDVQLPLIKEQ